MRLRHCLHRVVPSRGREEDRERALHHQHHHLARKSAEPETGQQHTDVVDDKVGRAGSIDESQVQGEHQRRRKIDRRRR